MLDSLPPDSLLPCAPNCDPQASDYIAPPDPITSTPKAKRRKRGRSRRRRTEQASSSDEVGSSVSENVQIRLSVSPTTRFSRLHHAGPSAIRPLSPTPHPIRILSERGTENNIIGAGFSPNNPSPNSSNSPPRLLRDAEDYPPSVTDLETWSTYIDSCRSYQESAVYITATSVENAAQLLVDNMISHVMDPFYDATEERVCLQHILYGYWTISL
jgi:hypothetical protein